MALIAAATSPPSQAVISSLFYSLIHFNATGGCDVPFQFNRPKKLDMMRPR
jgi:hypothetical protein